MSKKIALLVSAEVTTRIEIEVEDDFEIQNINSETFDEIALKAKQRLVNNLRSDYLDCVTDIELDTECPCTTEPLDSLKRKIRDEFMNTTFKHSYDAEEKLAKLVGSKCRCYDKYIDDGVDSDEDNYVMCASFDFADNPMRVSIYYGDYTRNISYVSIS